MCSTDKFRWNCFDIYVSFFFQDKEIANHGSAPRMLCLDDYFVTEVTTQERDPESGKMVEKVVSKNSF